MLEWGVRCDGDAALSYLVCVCVFLVIFERRRACIDDSDSKSTGEENVEARRWMLVLDVSMGSHTGQIRLPFHNVDISEQML